MASIRAFRSLRSSVSSSGQYLNPAAKGTHIQSPIASSLGLRRCYATEDAAAVEAPEYLDENERKIFGIIKTELKPTKLEVQDISGGCGSMYALDIVSEQFKGLPVIKQHRLVNSVLGDEIKKWHGVQLKTKAP